MTTAEEIWKDIPGYEGLYQASNLGKIKSLQRHIEVFRKGKTHSKIIPGVNLKPYNPSSGYSFIAICKNGKLKYTSIHRMVALAFLPNPNSYPIINHKNGIKTDNRVENLEWCTPLQNVRHAMENGFWFDVNTRKQNIPPSGSNSPYFKSKIEATNIHTLEKIYFESLSEARKYFGLKASANISSVIAGRKNHTHGHTFKRI